MSQVLESYGLNIEDQPAETMTMFAKVVSALGGTTNAGFTFFAGLAITTLVLYLRRRPKAAAPMTKFFDTSALMPDVDAADEALAGYKARLLVFAPKARRVFDVGRKEMTIGSAASADIRIEAARSSPVTLSREESPSSTGQRAG